MGELKNNPMMATASGMVGGTFVFRQWRGRLIIANRPKKGERVATEKQLAIQQKFTDASAYAKKALLDPATRAIYEAGINAKKYTAQMVAVMDYLNAPVVNEIDLSAYKGAIGDVINIKAADDFKVASVKVVILSATGEELESGDAVQDDVVALQWAYTAKAQNAAIAGTKVQVTAFDIPLHKGYLEKTL